MSFVVSAFELYIKISGWLRTVSGICIEKKLWMHRKHFFIDLKKSSENQIGLVKSWLCKVNKWSHLERIKSNLTKY